MRLTLTAEDVSNTGRVDLAIDFDGKIFRIFSKTQGASMLSTRAWCASLAPVSLRSRFDFDQVVQGAGLQLRSISSDRGARSLSQEINPAKYFKTLMPCFFAV